ncbi:MAG: hypothetical protein HY908_13745 [Myxococcales bacterium]|nr:hypothetical protein [Myxococcales bacterium]
MMTTAELQSSAGEPVFGGVPLLQCAAVTPPAVPDLDNPEHFGHYP